MLTRATDVLRSVNGLVLRCIFSLKKSAGPTCDICISAALRIYFHHPPPPIMERSSIQLTTRGQMSYSQREMIRSLTTTQHFFSYIKTRLSLLLLPKADDRIYVGVRTMVRVVQLTLRRIRPGPIMLSKDHPFPPGSKREGVLLS